MGMTGISKSQVSRLCEEIDGKVKAFLDRPIEGSGRARPPGGTRSLRDRAARRPYLWLDATAAGPRAARRDPGVKVRQASRVVSAAVIVAVGVNSDGRREVLGMDIGPSEAETLWTGLLRKLARRGLRGVRLVDLRRA
jgi:transposase-like protein